MLIGNYFTRRLVGAKDDHLFPDRNPNHVTNTVIATSPAIAHSAMPGIIPP